MGSMGSTVSSLRSVTRGAIAEMGTSRARDVGEDANGDARSTSDAPRAPTDILPERSSSTRRRDHKTITCAQETVL